MNFKITFQPDESYYSEAYDELISTYKFKKWVPVLAITMTVFWLGLFFLNLKMELVFICQTFYSAARKK